MAANRKSAGRRRTDVENDDPAAFNVRFDYSDAYLDNEDLDLQLEDHASLLHREKYRMCVEADEILKKTKQSADEMLQLKNAVKNRDPYESSNRVSKSADLKFRNTSEHTSTKHTGTKTSITDINSENVDSGSDTEKDNGDESDGKKDETASKPLNTLTMFLLSLQALKRHTNQQRKPEILKGAENEAGSKRNSHFLPPKHITKRSVSFHGRDEDIPDLLTSDVMSKGKCKTEYGMHVKKEHARSRRKLEEISRLDHDSKYGYLNKYEERRKRLLAECKDTKSVDERMKLFLKNVDDFKKESRDRNSLEKVLMRSKSAQFTRRNTFAW